MLIQLHITIILLLLAACTFAQSHRFADSTAQWNVLTFISIPNSIGGDVNGHWLSTDKYEVIGDTLIEARQYQQITNNIFLRRDSTQAIYRWNGNEDFIFYHFGKQPGDTLNYPVLAYPNANFRYVINNIDSIFIGKWRKTVAVTLIGDISFNADPPFTPHQQQDLWVDGIGMLDRHPFAPGLDMVYVSGAQKSTLCYSEYGNVLYQKNGYDICDTATVTAITKISNPVFIQLYPNPANNLINVTLHQNYRQAMFTLSDLTGRMVLQQPLTTDNTVVDITGISTGAYIYSITANNQPAITGKLHKPYY